MNKENLREFIAGNKRLRANVEEHGEDKVLEVLGSVIIVMSNIIDTFTVDSKDIASQVEEIFERVYSDKNILSDYGDVDFYIKYNHLEEICTDLDFAIDELYELVHKLETEEQIYERMGEYEALSNVNGERVKFRKCMRRLEKKREVVLEMLDEMDATLELNEKNRESFVRLFM